MILLLQLTGFIALVGLFIGGIGSIFYNRRLRKQIVELKRQKQELEAFITDSYSLGAHAHGEFNSALREKPKPPNLLLG